MRFTRVLGAIALSAPLVSGAQTPPAAGAPALRPAEDFYKLPAYRDIQLSPDGRMLAAIVPINGRSNLALVDLDKRTANALTGLSKEDVATFTWLGDRIIDAITVDLDQTGGVTETRQHVLIDVVDKKVLRDLQKISRFGQAGVLAPLDQAGDELVIQTRDRNVNGYDAYRLNALTGEKQLLTFQSPGDVRRFVADRKGVVRIAISVPRGGMREIVSYRKTNDDKWTTLRDESSDDVTFDPIAFDYDDRTLYVRVPDAQHGGRADVYAFDTETGQMGARVFEAKGADAGGTIADAVQRKIVGVRTGSLDGAEWFDPAWRQVQRAIDESLTQAHNRLSWGRDNTDRVLVRSETDVEPAAFYLLDRKTMSLEPVATAYPWLKGADLSPRRFVRYKARDGLSIPGYLTLPNHPDGVKPPLIVNIHGGPFVSAHGFGYDPDAQFFASRGYAVLEPHFRGTQGYGAAFEKAGWRQWGLAMQDDVTDGVKWLIDTGKVDGDRVCLFGASYGGYATLWGLEKEPAMFRCGVAFLAVSDLELMFDANWSDFMRGERGGDSTNWLRVHLGDPDTDREKLRAASPDLHADRLQAPLLLVYGGTDQRVPIIHGTRMRDALDRANKPYEWVVYNEQQHMRFDPVNGPDFYHRVEVFLAANLKPRTPPTALPADPAAKP